MVNKFTLQGKATNATVIASVIDDATIGQIQNFINEDYMKDIHVAIIPDTHAGKGAVIGTTMQIKDKVCPNLVGVDIGCGILVHQLNIADFNEDDFHQLEAVIQKYVPSGFDVHARMQQFKRLKDLTFTPKNVQRIRQSLEH